MASGDVKVDGLVEDGKRGIEMIGERDGMGFSIRGGEAAASVPGARDGSAQDGAGFIVEPCSEDDLLCGFDVLRGDIWNDEVLPYGETKLAGTEAVGDLCKSAHLLSWQSANRNRDTD